MTAEVKKKVYLVRVPFGWAKHAGAHEAFRRAIREGGCTDIPPAAAVTVFEGEDTDKFGADGMGAIHYSEELHRQWSEAEVADLVSSIADDEYETGRALRSQSLEQVSWYLEDRYADFERWCRKHEAVINKKPMVIDHALGALSE